MTDDRPAADLYDGCPNCKQSLRVEGSYVTCGNCGFKIAARPGDRPAVDREAVLDICRRYMGIERHAQHLVADLLDPRAELLRDAADVERDALAAVEALHFPKGHRITGEPLCDGCWTGGEYPCPTAQAVAGDRSALDAVKRQVWLEGLRAGRHPHSLDPVPPNPYDPEAT